MISGKMRHYRIMLFAFDAAAVVAAFLPAYYLIGVGLQHLLPGVKVVLPFSDYWWVPVLSIPMWWVLLAASGAYNIEQIPPTWASASKLIKPMLIGAMIIGFFIFALQEKDFSRRIIGSYLVLNYTLIVAERKLFSHWLNRAGSTLNLLIAGTGERVEKMLYAFKSSNWRVNIAGILCESQVVESEGYKVYLGIEKLSDALSANPVDGVIIGDLEGGIESLRRIIQCCEDFGIPVLIDPVMMGATISYPRVHSVRGIGMLEMAPGPRDPLIVGIKRGLDIILSGAVLFFFLPLLCLIALIIKSSTPGAVLFTQERFGLNGRRFRLYKFRSMHRDAEGRMAEVTGMNISDGPAFKAKNDPRVTPFGRILRKYGIDELPQLWNVLKGEMSLVGPRPLQIHEVYNIGTQYRRRLSMRPGITGLWQVSGGHSLPFEEWMRLDLRYIDTWSLWRDFVILLQTVPVVISGRNV